MDRFWKKFALGLLNQALSALNLEGEKPFGLIVCIKKLEEVIIQLQEIEPGGG